MNKKAIMSGKICPYCGSQTQLIDSKEIYGRSYGLMYICRPCDAYVGTHRGTDKALGRLANRELRQAKKRAHYYFDQIAMTDLINKVWKEYIPGISNRNKAYKWLSMKTGISPELCHIGMMDVKQCEKVIRICKEAIESL